MAEQSLLFAVVLLQFYLQLYILACLLGEDERLVDHDS